MVSTRRRAVQRENGMKYAIGDKIEVVRDEGVDVGILLRQEENNEDDDNGKNAPGAAAVHWLVSVEGGEEYVSERTLGRVLEAHDHPSSDESLKSATTTNSMKGKNSKSKVIVAAKKTTKSKPSKPSTAKKIASSSASSRRATTRAATRKNGNGKPDLMEGLDRIETVNRKVPSPKPKKKDGEETVVEVNMLTGTLFIYRGKHRRVEFVPTK